MWSVLVIAFAGIISQAAPVQAQELVRIGVNGGTQLGSRMVTQDFALPANLEQTSILNKFDLSGGGLYDLGASFHLTRGWWTRVAFSSLSRSTEGVISGQIPHPFYFNSPRTASGTVDDLKSIERDLHISASYLIPFARRLDLALFGGPTLFLIKQDMITTIDYEESYPYDAVEFRSATVKRVSESAWGFNAGADLTWKFSPRVGIGALVRFARATTTLTAGTGNDASYEAGGTQVAGGLRLMF